MYSKKCGINSIWIMYIFLEMTKFLLKTKTNKYIDIFYILHFTNVLYRELL